MSRFEKKEVEALLKNYKLLNYNKNNDYCMNAMLCNNIGFSISEKNLKIFIKSFSDLQSYPYKGSIYYDILKDRYINGKSMDEIASEHTKSISTLYLYRRQGIEVLTNLFKEALADEEKACV